MRKTLAACTALCLHVGVARAQWIVSDPATEAATLSQFGQTVAKDAVKIANQLTIIDNQITQIVHLRNTLAAVSHGNLAAVAELGPELSSAGLTNPFGADTAGLGEALSGLAGATGTLSSSMTQTASLAQNVMRTDMFYAPTGSDFRAAAINQTASSAAYQKVIAQAALDSSGKRLTELTSLRSSLSNTTDIKASTDASARFAGEQAMAQTQGNQLAAVGIMQHAQATTDAARELQAWRCSAEALVRQAGSSASSAASGAVILASSAATSSCNVAPAASPDMVAGGTTGTLVSATGGIGTADDGSTLSKMTSQPWGQVAARNASALGVNPTALAATCSLESNCTANPGGTGTISGAFQMSNGTYAQTVSEVQNSNPDLASQITSKNDPASQSIAAAEYLKDGATALQAAGIANPTVLDVRGYYNYGPGFAASLATAPGNQLMTTTLAGMSSSTLAANGISANMTVDQWRTSITNKIGASAASQPVLLGMNT